MFFVLHFIFFEFFVKSLEHILSVRVGDGELRLGIRRAAQVKTSPTFPASSHLFNASSITAAVNAISSRSVFNICYNPR